MTTPHHAAILQSQIALSIARANWWTAYAHTPANKGRIVTDGIGRRHTPDDLIGDAMTTANNHLAGAQKCLEQLNALPL